MDEERLEKQLLKTKSGDEDALAEVLYQLAPQLRAYCESLINSKWKSVLSADDILQESYTEVFASVRAFRGSTVAEFVGWVKKICKNDYLDADRYLSAQKRNPGQIMSLNKEDSLMHLFEVVCDDDSPRMTLSKQETLKKLAESIQVLPADYAAVILAIDIEGRSVSELATDLKITEGALYMRRSRALRELRKNLGSSIEF